MNLSAFSTYLRFIYKGVLMTLLGTCECMKNVEGDEVVFVTGVSKIRIVRETVRHFESK